MRKSYIWKIGLEGKRFRLKGQRLLGDIKSSLLLERDNWEGSEFYILYMQISHKNGRDYCILNLQEREDLIEKTRYYNNII